MTKSQPAKKPQPRKPAAPPPPPPPPEKLLDLPEGFEIWRMSPLTPKEQDKNARVQSPATFRALTRNVTKRGALESLPFLVRSGEEFFLVSGHHRNRAAIAANLLTTVYLVDPSPRTRSEVRAKQVAHNSISGSDDPAVLLQLLDEIDDVDALLEASVDRDALEQLAAAPTQAQDVKVDYDWKIISFAFLPKHVKDLEELILTLGNSDLVVTTDIGAHVQVLAAMKALGKADDIRSMGAIAYRMVEIVNAYLSAKGAVAAPAPEPPPDAPALCPFCQEPVTDHTQDDERRIYCPPPPAV